MKRTIGLEAHIEAVRATSLKETTKAMLIKTRLHCWWRGRYQYNFGRKPQRHIVERNRAHRKEQAEFLRQQRKQYGACRWIGKYRPGVGGGL